MSERKEQWLEELIRLTEGDEKKKTDKQAKILEAAIEIFAEKGFAATSTSEIAQKAGVAEGTIFRHYKTKKDLLLSIAGPIASKLVAPFLARDFAKVIDLPYEKADDFFRSVARDRLRFARNNEKLIRILIHEVPFQPELMEQMKAMLTEIVAARMKRVVEHFQNQGQLIEAPPWRIVRSAASMFIGMIIFHVILAPDFPFDDDEEIDRTLDLLMHGISGRKA
ncbi:TetR/AcrR family transcriptional regulator [Paenibacillus arenilitoris]|uniref:TetR/AcrR family transcriptional regulator n=1 Tax=Paenibacillus arenilitoris TaxID=2772299 RepID=A0A927H8Q3_9BACL|nr:TetR/AcrR family transcriptional regulator [Paenibacillus arenilitoris]MBD2870844.1 TetR/AcrR family transcriptional regulator [Paenibacillus arenilitoris]